MNVYYDDEVDALYLRLGDQMPDGVIEVTDGVNIVTTADGQITGIEILNASRRLSIDTILSYHLEFNEGLLPKKKDA